MSYIEDVLYGKQSNHEIAAFLRAEGFQIGTGPEGDDGFIYTTTGRHTVHITVVQDQIKVYIEYAESDDPSSNHWWFERDDFEDFKEKYIGALHWAQGYI